MNRPTHKGNYLHVLIGLAIMALLAWPFYMKRAKPMEFHSSQELATFLQINHFQGYKFVAQGQHPEVDNGGYLVASDVDIDPRMLATIRDFKDQWKGVLMFKLWRNLNNETLQTCIDQWQDMGIYRAGFLFFGDPDLIAKIVQLFP